MVALSLGWGDALLTALQALADTLRTLLNVLVVHSLLLVECLFLFCRSLCLGRSTVACHLHFLLCAALSKILQMGTAGVGCWSEQQESVHTAVPPHCCCASGAAGTLTLLLHDL